VTVDSGNGVAAVAPGPTGMAARTSGVSDGPGEALFRAVFSADDAPFFFLWAGVGDFFFPPALPLCFALGVGDGVL
jgi:hypothetical protein